jgi:hypothetical protein
MKIYDRRPDIAALVNGGLVVLVPQALAVLLPVLLPDTHTVTVRPPDAPVIARTLRDLGQMAVALLPFAVLAGWRTRVHAIEWCQDGDTGWRGVLEGGAAGFLIAFLVLLQPTLLRPMDAPPYIIAYGGAAMILGLLIAFFLRITALLVLRLSTRL